MGQKVHPIGFRTGVIRTWSSVWFANKNYAQLLHEDLKLRDYIKKRLYSTQVARIDIERAGKKAKVHIYTARPGLVIGQRGAEVDKLRHELELLTGRELLINIHEVLTPELNAQLVAENIASQLERRIAFRRAMKKSMQNTIRLGAQGVRLRVSGRLNGAEIARTEQSREGSVPLHTLRADVDYGQATAFTTYGTIGVKCWIYHGELAPGEMVSGLSGDAESGSRRRGRGGSGGGQSPAATSGGGSGRGKE